jgi:hypothetical protein
MFTVGVVTSVLVVTAWTTNLFAKPLATVFGGSVSLLGLVVVGATQYRRRQRGLPGPIPHVERLAQLHLVQGRNVTPPLVALVHGSDGELAALVDTALDVAGGAKVMFLFIGARVHTGRHTQLREIVDPYLQDEDAHAAFRKVQERCGRRSNHRLVYAAGTDDGTEVLAQALKEMGAARILAVEGDEARLGGIEASDQRVLEHRGVRLALLTLAVPA